MGIVRVGVVLLVCFIVNITAPTRSYFTDTPVDLATSEAGSENKNNPSEESDPLESKNSENSFTELDYVWVFKKDSIFSRAYHGCIIYNYGKLEIFQLSNSIFRPPQV